MVPPLVITPLCQHDALNEDGLVRFVIEEWKDVSFPLYISRVSSPIIPNVNYIDLNMENIESIIRAEILEDRKIKEST